MHVTLYHDALIPPPKYGGTERIIYWLGKALIALGHDVTLIAHRGSHIDGARLIELPARENGRWEERVPPETDLLHLWATPHRPPPRPFLVTIQGNGRPGETFHPNTVFISGRHAANHGASTFVYNGIDPDDYACDEERADDLVFLAKASWKVKNLQGAIEIARASGSLLHVLGSRDLPLGLQRSLPAFRGVRYWGMVGDEEKKSVLRKARALLFPVRWPEPFGIAITEALASGCAVFGTPYGSLPEIVSEPVGLLSADASELIAGLKTRHFSPQACRARVVQGGFTHLDMARKYLGLYAKILEAGSLRPGVTELRCRFTEPAETLLPWKGPRR